MIWRSATVAISAILVLSASCVTRGKHEATVSDWQGKYGDLSADKDRQAADSKKQLADKDSKISGLETELELYKEKTNLRTADLEGRLEKRKAEVEALRKQRATIEASLSQYRKLREAFNKMIDAGELQVYHRRGRIMVALPSSVLFASGKARLSKAGQTAVAQVARVLARLQGRRFLIAGHTDNVPIRTSRFSDNWALSAARATTVTRDLIANGLSPNSVAAAGYGEYDAIVPNDTKENKKRNRRIEIILMPNIEELPELPD